MIKENIIEIIFPLDKGLQGEDYPFKELTF